MEAEAETQVAAVVEIVPGRAPVDVVLGAIDAALRSGIAGLVVGVALPADDERRAPLEQVTAADARVTIAAPGTSRPAADLVFVMPARARPDPRTLGRVAAIVRERGLESVDVPVPGRYPALARLGLRGRLRVLRRRLGQGDPPPGRGRSALDRHPGGRRAAAQGLARRGARGAPAPPGALGHDARAHGPKRPPPFARAPADAPRARAAAPRRAAARPDGPGAVDRVARAERRPPRRRPAGRRRLGGELGSRLLPARPPLRRRPPALAPSRGLSYGSIAVSSKRRPRHSRCDWIRK